MADLSKRLEKAEKYLQKGKLEDALAEYLSILDSDPSNDAIRQQAADLCVTVGKNQEACGLLSILFDHQAAINDQAKAIANYKKLARMGTPTVEQTFKFSQFIEKSDKKLALEGYSLAVNSFLASDRRAEAIAGYKRMVLIDPSAANHKSMGELAAVLGDSKTAAASFFRLAELEPGNAPTWLERGYGLDPANLPLALTHGRSLIEKNSLEKAIQVLGPIASAPNSDAEFREAYAQALMASGRPEDAEPFVWELFEKDPSKLEDVGTLIGTLLRENNNDKALVVSAKLEHQMNKLGKRREFVSLMKEVTAKFTPNTEFLEYMVGVYNSANREHDYCEALIGLFQLYYASGNFLKAVDCLDRAVEVDPYEAGNHKRLEMLRGKVDQQRCDAIANRFQTAGAATSEETNKTAQDQVESEPTVLEDFMLQAEIFIQYSMRSKAIERLERIHKLFPHEENKNEKLHNLYVTAGFVPQYANEPGVPQPGAAASASSSAQGGQESSQGARPPAASAAPPRVSAMSFAENSVDNFSRVTEITRNIYRQSTVKGVLFAAVNDVGRHYNASRCIAGLLTPGKPPSAALEYCASGIKQSEVQHIIKLLAATQALTVQSGIVSLDDAQKAPQLAAIKESVKALGIASLLAVPLLDAASDEHVGILLLEQCDQHRSWRPTDAMVLKTIADQMVLAVNNAKLRNLMKNLAVTDEKSGLLKRSSYLDVLLSETRRALAQNSTASVLLLHFGKAATMVKEMGEPSVENLMQQIGQSVCSQIRQNDVAVRYELTTIALILPDTTDKNAFFVVDKMRKVLTGFKISGAERPVQITVGIAEAVMQAQYDPIDIVTEAINRAEAALEAAKQEGPNTAKSLAPKSESAVA